MTDTKPGPITFPDPHHPPTTLRLTATLLQGEAWREATEADVAAAGFVREPEASPTADEALKELAEFLCEHDGEPSANPAAEAIRIMQLQAATAVEQGRRIADYKASEAEWRESMRQLDAREKAQRDQLQQVDAILRDAGLKSPELDGNIPGRVRYVAYDRADIIEANRKSAIASTALTDELRGKLKAAELAPRRPIQTSPFREVAEASERDVTSEGKGVVTLEFEREADGRWVAEIPEVPGAMAYGPDLRSAVRGAMAIALCVLNDDRASAKSLVPPSRE